MREASRPSRPYDRALGLADHWRLRVLLLRLLLSSPSLPSPLSPLLLLLPLPSCRPHPRMLAVMPVLCSVLCMWWCAECAVCVVVVAAVAAVVVTVVSVVAAAVAAAAAGPLPLLPRACVQPGSVQSGVQMCALNLMVCAGLCARLGHRVSVRAAGAGQWVQGGLAEPPAGVRGSLGVARRRAWAVRAQPERSAT